MAAKAVIVSCGMITSVGLSAPEVAASARSRLQRIGEISWRSHRQEKFVVAKVPEEGLPEASPTTKPLTRRVVQMLRLAEVSLEEALQPLPKKVGKIPLMLGLPEPETWGDFPINGTDFIERLAEKYPIDAAKSELFPSGRASAILALQSAFLQVSSGDLGFCLVGGVDCLVDLRIMATLDGEKRIRNPVNPDGFAPGEGAGFLLMTSAELATRYQLIPQVEVAACASGVEAGHLYSEEPYKGDGLAEVFTNLFKAASEVPPVGCVYSSFNGERYWGKEFGVAMLRNRPKFVLDHQMEHPAECFGDLGAAHGAVMLGLAAVGVQEGYCRAPTLVYSSSDRGNRGATIFTKNGND